MAAHGEHFWVELNTGTPDPALPFYAKVLGWEIQDGPVPGGTGRYIVGMVGGKPVAGIFPLEGEMAAMPTQWVTYFAVRSIDAAVAAVVEAGGQVLHGPFPVPTVGRIAMVSDPVGAYFGLCEPEPG